MRDRFLILHSGQQRAGAGNGREGKVAEGLRKSLARAGLTESQSFDDLPAHVIAFSNAGDEALAWVERRDANVWLVGSFPSRPYAARGTVHLFYGADDLVTWVEPGESIDPTKAEGPESYASEQAALVNGRVEIVDGADHFLHDPEGRGVARLSASVLREHGVRNFGRYSDRFSRSPIHAHPRSAAEVRARFVDTIRICDVGCGAGHWGNSIARPSDHVTFVDPSADMLARAGVRRLSKTYAARAEDIPLAGGRFDLVTTRLAFHHFANARLALAEMARLTAPGGLVVVNDLVAATDPRLREVQHQIECLHDCSHVGLRTADEFASDMRAVGLTPLDATSEGFESAEGLPIEKWFDLVGTSAVARERALTLLAPLNDDELSALGFRRRFEEYSYHARTITVMAQKE